MSCDRKLSPFAIAVLVVSALGANVALAEPEQGFPNDSRYSGVSFAKIGNVVSADAVGFGRAASDTTYPTLFISGNVNNVIGIFRSTNAGKSWTRINDDHHQWGSIGTVVGDPRVFGRVYLGTNGRGIIYGDPASGN
jgi:xyloglucan-specific exo-beta-1,4-glucanase